MSEFAIEDVLKLEMRMHTIMKERVPFVDRKIDIDARLSQLNEMVKGKTLPQNKYNKYCIEQNSLKREKIDIDKKLKKYKDEIRDISCKREEFRLTGKSHEGDGVLSIVKAIVALRDEYESFAGDHTRVSSMRTMAANFSKQLSLIIRAS